MKKNVIAILLSLVVAVSSIGPVPVIAAETTAAAFMPFSLFTAPPIKSPGSYSLVMKRQVALELLMHLSMDLSLEILDMLLSWIDVAVMTAYSMSVSMKTSMITWSPSAS